MRLLHRDVDAFLLSRGIFCLVTVSFGSKFEEGKPR